MTDPVMSKDPTAENPQFDYSKRTIKFYGYVPDFPDFRDLAYKPTGIPQPTRTSVRSKMPPVFDQGELGSCTANAAAACLAFEHGGGPYSRLQIYYDERLINGTVNQDSGAQGRDAIKVMAQQGAALESHWPYDVSKFKENPPPTVDADALKTRISVYSSLTKDDPGRSADRHLNFRDCLANGYPFMIGATVYGPFESDDVADTGIVPYPKETDEMVGGHEFVVIGYDDDFKNLGAYYECRNSWGESWGDEGNFWLPIAYLENPNLADDAWTVRK